MSVFHAVTTTGISHDFTAEAIWLTPEGAVEFYNDNGLIHVVAAGAYLYIEKQAPL